MLYPTSKKPEVGQHILELNLEDGKHSSGVICRYSSRHCFNRETTHWIDIRDLVAMLKSRPKAYSDSEALEAENTPSRQHGKFYFDESEITKFLKRFCVPEPELCEMPFDTWIRYSDVGKYLPLDPDEEVIFIREDCFEEHAISLVQDLHLNWPEAIKRISLYTGGK